MENWDEEKLRNVVLSKQGNPRTTTDVCWSFIQVEIIDLNFSYKIVCKYFIEAIETQKSVLPVPLRSYLLIISIGSAGSGSVQMAEKIVSTDTPYHPVSSLSPRRKQQRMQRRQTLLALRNS